MDRLGESLQGRDVSTPGATGTTAVAPKFLSTLTLSQPGGGADSAHHQHGRTQIFLVVLSLLGYQTLPRRR